MKSRCRQALAFSENRRSAAIFCFYRHRLCGAHELRQQYALSGRHPFLHRPGGMHELRKRVRPYRAGCFSLNLSGEWRRLQAARTLRLRAAGAQEGRQPAVFHPLVNLPFSLRGHGEICRVETIGERQRIFSSVSFPTYSQCQTHFCYTGRLLDAGCGITVPHNSLVWRLRTAPTRINYTGYFNS